MWCVFFSNPFLYSMPRVTEPYIPLYGPNDHCFPLLCSSLLAYVMEPINSMPCNKGQAQSMTLLPPMSNPCSSRDLLTSDHSDPESPHHLQLLSAQHNSFDKVPHLVCSESYSANAFIFDAYAWDNATQDKIEILSR